MQQGESNNHRDGAPYPTLRIHASALRHNLAQLRAIAEGDAAPQRDDQPPPIGLDPSRGGGRGRL